MTFSLTIFKLPAQILLSHDYRSQTRNKVFVTKEYKFSNIFENPDCTSFRYTVSDFTFFGKSTTIVFK